jgi:hypothetical protein
MTKGEQKRTNLRKSILDGLQFCKEGERRKFEKMYNANGYSEIEEIVKKMPKKSLQHALVQVENTLRKRQTWKGLIREVAERLAISETDSKLFVNLLVDCPEYKPSFAASFTSNNLYAAETWWSPGWRTFAVVFGFNENDYVNFDKTVRKVCEKLLEKWPIEISNSIADQRRKNTVDTMEDIGII